VREDEIRGRTVYLAVSSAARRRGILRYPSFFLDAPKPHFVGRSVEQWQSAAPSFEIDKPHLDADGMTAICISTVCRTIRRGYRSRTSL
jgi:hypothetical protein